MTLIESDPSRTTSGLIADRIDMHTYSLNKLLFKYRKKEIGLIEFRHGRTSILANLQKEIKRLEEI